MNDFERDFFQRNVETLKIYGFEEKGFVRVLSSLQSFYDVNMELLDSAATVRMLDFLNGVTYCTDGDIKNVSRSTYIITPHNVDVSDED